ncbi:MAG: TIGR02449 family protein [Gammaproteobacteria bacterium]|jgi:cell division protein ZapB|nr:TIGR02449 family protein [Gammaproteobacteria bacterium]
MEKDDLQQLEKQIDDLLKVSRRTREENMLLKSQQSAWVTERAKLVERTELARSRIDKMVERLKELDNEL